MKKEKTVTVLKSSLDSLADGIANVSAIGKSLKNSALNERAILILLSHMTGEPQVKIKTILDALPELEKRYLK